MADSPDIVLVITEQHRGDCLGVEGHPVLLTPTMDNMAQNGVRFTRAYSACPSCIAARRSILAGQDPQTHGMVGYCSKQEWDPPATLPQVLRENGYQTYWVGRSMHQWPVRKRFGFDEMELHEDYLEWLRDTGPRDNDGWFSAGVMNNDWTARPWPYAEYLHEINWTVSRALRFLKRRDPSCPYFLVLSFMAAHPPLQPAACYFERYLRTGVPDPVIGDWATPPDSGGPLFDNVSALEVDLQGEKLLSTRAGYYGLLNHLDDQLRRFFHPMGGINLGNNKKTVVLLTSDHGEMLGDHYMWRKGRAYEPSARVPFILCSPSDFEIQKNVTSDAVVTLADIMPTLLDFAGVSAPGSVDGRSLLPVLRGEEERVREALHIEHAPFQHALTDGQEKFIWNVKDGREQFFDLVEDPNEMHDAIGDPDRQERVRYWRAQLIGRLKDRAEGFTDGSKLIAGRPYKTLLDVGVRYGQAASLA